MAKSFMYRGWVVKYLPTEYGEEGIWVAMRPGKAGSVEGDTRAEVQSAIDAFIADNQPTPGEERIVRTTIALYMGAIVFAILFFVARHYGLVRY